MTRIITSSWDDGHPLDHRLAELLHKYNIPATFYVPQSNQEHEVMPEKSIEELSRSFEIGGHTLHHIRLNGAKHIIENEIEGCYDWLKGLTGHVPTSFCFPGGVYNDNVIQIARQKGFTVLRTTELLSVKTITAHQLTPTTLQVYQGSTSRYIRHLAKRVKIKSFINWGRSGFDTNLLALTDFYLERVISSGGCFHLWGHSWEIDEHNLWDTLELMLQKITGIRECTYLTNGEMRGDQT